MFVGRDRCGTSRGDSGRQPAGLSSSKPLGGYKTVVRCLLTAGVHINFRSPRVIYIAVTALALVFAAEILGSIETLQCTARLDITVHMLLATPSTATACTAKVPIKASLAKLPSTRMTSTPLMIPITQQGCQPLTLRHLVRTRDGLEQCQKLRCLSLSTVESWKEKAVHTTGTLGNRLLLNLHMATFVAPRYGTESTLVR